jgi:hypothetical protein
MRHVEREDLLLIDDALWVLTTPTGISIYDFAFDRLLAGRRPYNRPDSITAVARVGAIPEYSQYYDRWQSEGIRLIHTPAEHTRASELPAWYPLIEGLTPKSLWSKGSPDVDTVERELGWPIFMKGVRQTSHHKKSLSIIEGREHFKRALDAFANDPILHWQEIVCRQYTRLRPVEDVALDRIPSSFEFRTFWWRGELVGFGRYWWEAKVYAATEAEKSAATALARKAVERIAVPFLVVDVAQDSAVNWLIIECNDGQESGYAGISPIAVWQNIVAHEKALA